MSTVQINGKRLGTVVFQVSISSNTLMESVLEYNCCVSSFDSVLTSLLVDKTAPSTDAGRKDIIHREPLTLLILSPRRAGAVSNIGNIDAEAVKTKWDFFFYDSFFSVRQRDLYYTAKDYFIYGYFQMVNGQRQVIRNSRYFNLFHVHNHPMTEIRILIVVSKLFNETGLLALNAWSVQSFYIYFVHGINSLKNSPWCSI